MDLIMISDNRALLDAGTSQQIAEFEKMIKSLKEKEEELKKAILEEMEQKNIIKLETEEMTISYVASYDKETFQTKEFKKEYAGLYDAYVKLSPVKPSIRIKLKEG